MRINILIGLARQVEGELVFVNVIKSHTDLNYLSNWLRDNPQPRTGTFEGVECVVEYGIMRDIEVEGV